MKTEERVRAMRAEGIAFAEISRRLGVGLQWAYKCGASVKPTGVRDTRRSIVRHFPHNGGCSTQSGMMPVSLPRITALHGEYAGDRQVAA